MQFSTDYQTQKMHEIHDSTSTEITMLNTNVKNIKDTQAGLAESLQLLTQQIAEQHQLAIQTEQAEANEWAKLQEDTQDQATSLNALQETTMQTLNRTAETLYGTSDLGGGCGALKGVSEKVSILGKIFGGLCQYLVQILAQVQSHQEHLDQKQHLEPLPLIDRDFIGKTEEATIQEQPFGVGYPLIVTSNLKAKVI